MRMLAVGSLFLLAALASASGGTDMAPGAVPQATRTFPTLDELKRGPLRVRLLPTTRTPPLMIPIYRDDDPWLAGLVSAVRRLGLGDAWYAGFTSPGPVDRLLATGQPVCLYVDHDALLRGRLATDPGFARRLDELCQDRAACFFTFTVAEWENLLWRWWDTGSRSEQRQAVFGLSDTDVRSLDRQGFYRTVQQAYRRWRSALRGHASTQNGYAMLSHLTGEAGSDFLGIETGENIPATQVKRAFARGAARQYGLPWWEDVSAWYYDGIPAGDTPELTVLPTGVHVGPHTGHSPSLLERLWATAWFAGAACVAIEGATYLFEVKSDAPAFPESPRLTDYGVRAQRLFGLMKTLDVGVPYAPFGVIVNKFHGRWSVWGPPWGYLAPTAGDRMTERFFGQVFPGMSGRAGQGGRCLEVGDGFDSRAIAGEEEYYLCPTPYGEVFDVLVHDSDRAAWGAYPVLLAVGDIPWTPHDIAYLMEYVHGGGIVALNEQSLAGWERGALGLAPSGFAPRGEGRTILASADRKPLLIRRDLGKGHFLISAARPDPAVPHELAFPDALLRSLSRAFLPFQVEGEVQFLVNRTNSGWAVLLVNNAGFTKRPYDPPRVDPSRTQRVRVTVRAARVRAREVYVGDAVRSTRPRDGETWRFTVDVPPGEVRLLMLEV